MSGEKLSVPQPEALEVVPHIVGIFTSEDKGLLMTRHDSIQAIAGVGLEGDRYATGKGAFLASRTGDRNPRIPDEWRQVSLIATGAIQEANDILEGQGINPFTPADTRRNLVVATSSAQLNNLVGKEFTLGGVTMKGVELCDPCGRPPTVLKRDAASRREFPKAFENRGGLRAQILTSGEIKTGDQLITKPQ